MLEKWQTKFTNLFKECYVSIMFPKKVNFLLLYLNKLQLYNTLLDIATFSPVVQKGI